MDIYLLSPNPTRQKNVVKSAANPTPAGRQQAADGPFLIAEQLEHRGFAPDAELQRRAAPDAEGRHSLPGATGDWSYGPYRLSSLVGVVWSPLHSQASEWVTWTILAGSNWWFGRYDQSR